MVDPIPALRALFDLPLRTKLDETTTARLSELDARGRRPDAKWADLYAESLQAAERMVADCDARADELQKRTLSLDEAMEKLRAQGGPRHQLDTTRAELKQAAAALKQDWRARLQRQVEQLQDQTREAMTSIQCEVEARKSGAELKVKGAWLLEFNAYVEKLLGEWRAQLPEKVSITLTEKTTPILASVKDLTAGAPPLASTARYPPAEPMRLQTTPQPFEVPAFGAALLQYVRGHLMTASMMGTMLFAAGAALISVGTGGKSMGSTIAARGWLVLLALPPSVVFGIFAARRQRKTALTKGRETKQQALSTSLTQDIHRVFARQAAELERSVSLQVDAGLAGLDSWLTSSALPAIGKLEAAQQEQTRNLRLEQRQLQERAGEVRTLRNQLSQNVVPELRRRLRDLEASRVNA